MGYIGVITKGVILGCIGFRVHGFPKLGVPLKGDYRGYNGLYIGVTLGNIGVINKRGSIGFIVSQN